MAIEPLPVSLAPVRKVAAGGMGGAASVLILYVLEHYAGISVPAEVASAASVLITFAVSYFTPSAPGEVA